jgi:YHS domain-containing protein
MEGLFSFLIFGLFFYLIMRFGCGAHMVHGQHGSGQAGNEAHSKSFQDPVCGMSVDQAQGYAKMHGGHEYHFCSRNCLDKFEADPQSYLSKKGGIS